MKFVLLGIVLAVGIYYGMQTPAVRSHLLGVQAAGRGVASRIVGDLAR